MVEVCLYESPIAARSSPEQTSDKFHASLCPSLCPSRSLRTACNNVGKPLLRCIGATTWCNTLLFAPGITFLHLSLSLPLSLSLCLSPPLLLAMLSACPQAVPCTESRVSAQTETAGWLPAGSVWQPQRGWRGPRQPFDSQRGRASKHLQATSASASALGVRSTDALQECFICKDGSHCGEVIFPSLRHCH